MRLRTILATIAAGGFFLALLACLRDTGFLPPTIGLALITAALLIERQRYGAHATPPAGATATDERFVDPETGRMMRVWYDAASGERSYVEDEAG